ncbi:transcription initiation factor IIB [Podochytrium sp. JEL0797]|nr:transcription initiation factor IIB [Podochytrium sp. JEL0797]
MNLNIHLVCSDCQDEPPHIIESSRDGDLICGDCGLVLCDRQVDTRGEWRTFAEDGGDGSRVGDSADTLIGDANTLESTTISRKDGGTGRAKDISRIHSKLIDTKKDNKLYEAAKLITATTEHIGLSKTVTDSTIQIYKASTCIPKLAKHPLEHVTAACIHLACNANGVKRTFKEICGATNVPFKKLGKIYLALKEYLKKERKELGIVEMENSVESIVRRFAMDLELSQRVGNRVFKQEILGGRSTITLAAAVIYFVVCLSDIRKTRAEIAGNAQCTTQTLANAFKMLLRHKEILVAGLKTERGLDALPSS